MSGLPQKVLDLFDQVASKPGSSSTSSSSSSTSDSGAAADAATSHTLPTSTRVIAFDNTAFLPPAQCATTSDIFPFPSGICLAPSTSASSTPLPPCPENAKHLAEFVVAFLTSKSGEPGVLDNIAAGIITTLGIVQRGGAEEENVRHRLAMFLGLMKKGQRAVVVAQDSNSATGGGERVVCGPSSGNGISSDLRWVGFPGDLAREGKKEIVWKVLTAPGDERRFEMRTFFTGGSGWTVVSDVDDTIKISQVNDRIALLRNTFVADPSPVSGMPAFYQAINAKLNPDWFYLSASPWQLYPFLHDFLSSSSPSSTGQTLYPRGQLILRDMNRGAMPVYLSALTMGTRAYKFDRLEKIHSWLSEPKRRVLLIGDSTQTDPEAYGDAARKWPSWVGGIWIRVVKGVNEQKEKDLNDPKRFEKAFEGVDRSVWRTFGDPNELGDALAGLKA